MNGKAARKLRKILNLKSKENWKELAEAEVGIKRIAIIDGIKDEIREEERAITSYFTNEDRALYRYLKEAYTKFPDGKVSKELKQDLKEVK